MTHPTAKYALKSSEIELLEALNFNRWHYSRSYAPWSATAEERRHSGGKLVYQTLTNGNVVIQLPAWLVRDALAGKANAVGEYGLNDKDLAFQMLTGEWEIVGVKIIGGDLERGTPGGGLGASGPLDSDGAKHHRPGRHRELGEPYVVESIGCDPWNMARMLPRL